MFTLFPEFQEKFVTYCNKQIKQGALSTEECTTEVRTKIIPECYENLLKEAGDDKEEMPTYNEILSMCDLKTISIPCIWKWLLHLGYKYSENKRCYYTDGHEREDVVNDRENRFLIDYFKMERRCYRWVQITTEESKELEKKMDYLKIAIMNILLEPPKCANTTWILATFWKLL